MCTCFTMSWNTQAVAYTQKNADFVARLCDKIIEYNTDLVAIGLQEDSIRGSNLINNETSLIVNGLKSTYSLLEITELSGWGVTTYKALKNDWEYCPRGLRLALFKRNTSDISIHGISVNAMVCPSLRDWITAGKGGVCIKLDTSHGSIAFLNVHLPFSSRSILKSNERHPALLWQAQCLEELYQKCQRDYNPNHIIVLGDLNFRVQLRGATETATAIAKELFTPNASSFINELIAEADELRLLINYPQSTLPKLLEGVNNAGPTFLPTCKLAHGRGPIELDKEKVFKCGKLEQRTPSWCDRILYTKDVRCTEYDRWDDQSMNQSDHAAVFAILQLLRTIRSDKKD